VTFASGRAPYVKPAMRDFKVGGHGPGTGIRHRILD
jgi:hypothetical protein